MPEVPDTSDQALDALVEANRQALAWNTVVRELQRLRTENATLRVEVERLRAMSADELAGVMWDALHASTFPWAKKDDAGKEETLEMACAGLQALRG